MWLDLAKDLLGLLSRTSPFMRGQVPYEIPPQFLTGSSEDSIIRKSISLLHALSTLLCLQGRQFPDANLPGLPPEERKAIFEAAMKTLAQLQSIDTDKLNLDCIGDKENFFQQRVGTIIIHITEASNPKHSSQRVFKWLIFITLSVIKKLRTVFSTAH